MPRGSARAATCGGGPARRSVSIRRWPSNKSQGRPSLGSVQPNIRHLPVDFVPDHWQRFVAPEGQPKRRAYELCTLSTLRDKLRSGDIYLPNSRRYTDPETFLIPRSEWLTLRTDVCQQLDLDPTGKA